MELTACITTYNRKDYLKRALESLITQTVKDFRILILDNNSEDGTESLVLEYKSLAKELDYVKHESMSISKQRNLGLKLAKTNYIGFLDDDDYWSREKVEAFYKDLALNNEMSLWYSGFAFFEENEKGRCRLYSGMFDKKVDFINLLAQGGPFTGSASNPIIKVEKVVKIGCYDERIYAGEDAEMYFRLAAKYSFTGNSDILVFIRKHTGKRLSDNLRRLAITESIVLKQFGTVTSRLGKRLTIKLATKLTRLNKPRFARRVILRNYYINHVEGPSIDDLVLIAIYVLSSVDCRLYSKIHRWILALYRLYCRKAFLVKSSK